MDKFVSFDIETTKPAPNEVDGDWNLGVTCIGAVIYPEATCRHWHGGQGWDGTYAATMPVLAVREFCYWLLDAERRGYDVLAFNGAGFDLKVLAHSVGDDELSLSLFADLADLAWRIIDPAFQFFCEKGWMTSLKAFATGMRVGDKTEGMDGLAAVEHWASGDPEKQQKVLEYVVQDCVVAGDAYVAMVESGDPWYTTKSSDFRKRKMWRPFWSVEDGHGVQKKRVMKRLASYDVREYESRRLLRVRECLDIPEPPAPGWLEEPWVRDRFVGWLDG